MNWTTTHSSATSKCSSGSGEGGQRGLCFLDPVKISHNKNAFQ